MSFIVATNVVASWPPERRLTLGPFGGSVGQKMILGGKPGPLERVLQEPVFFATLGSNLGISAMLEILQSCKLDHEVV